MVNGCDDAIVELMLEDSKRYTSLVAIAAACATALITIIVMYLVQRSDAAAYGASVSAAPPFTDSCNVLNLQLHGMIVGTRSDVFVSDIISSSDGSGMLLTPNYTVASDITYALDMVKTSPNIKAILVDINSSGGSAAAGAEIALALRNAGIPTIAVIHDMSLSAAYLAAAATNKVYAREMSTIGSIGITVSYVSQYEKDKKEGYTYEQLSSGPYKDMFSPDRKMTDAERMLIERDLKISHEAFVHYVSQFRNMPLEAVEALADGSSVMGKQALESKLVDSLGGRDEALTYLESTIGTSIEPCYY